jgi:hypothetical protein
MASPFILWLWPRCANKIKGEDMKDEDNWRVSVARVLLSRRKNHATLTSQFSFHSRRSQWLPNSPPLVACVYSRFTQTSDLEFGSH